MSTETKNKKLRSSEASKKSAEPQNPSRDPCYDSDKKVYEERCEAIFNAWQEDRKTDAKRRGRYAFGITIFVGLQVLAVYGCIIAHHIWRPEITSTAQTFEYLGAVGAILTQSFGVFYLVVKYFFGERPEDLEKISTFFLKCHPSRFGAGYRQDGDQKAP